MITVAAADSIRVTEVTDRADAALVGEVAQSPVALIGDCVQRIGVIHHSIRPMTSYDVIGRMLSMDHSDALDAISDESDGRLGDLTNEGGIGPSVTSVTRIESAGSGDDHCASMAVGEAY